MASQGDPPTDELLERALAIGLLPADDVSAEELQQQVRQREEFIAGLDEAVLDELAAWAGVSGTGWRSREQLVCQICLAEEEGFGSLSEAGLRTLAALRNIDAPADCSAEELRRALGERKGVARLFRTIWRTLRKDGKAFARMPRKMVRHGVLGGLGSTILSAGADAYVAEKLNEIEARIDRKLDEIDQRLDEWRDREVANRLKIIRITLIISVIIAAISLAYAWIHKLIVGG